MLQTPKPTRRSARCRRCGADALKMSTIPYTVEVRYEGRVYEVHVPRLRLPVCGACGAKSFTSDVDEQVNDALRQEVKLLTPEQIRAAIHDLGLSQKEFAAVLGVAEATVSRWCTGTVIQSKAMDNLMRAYFASPSTRDTLARIASGEHIEIGATAVH
jgi:putative zinc finger/helix-turn-helix YgiT family protein